MTPKNLGIGPDTNANLSPLLLLQQEHRDLVDVFAMGPQTANHIMIQQVTIYQLTRVLLGIVGALDRDDPEDAHELAVTALEELHRYLTQH